VDENHSEFSFMAENKQAFIATKRKQNEQPNSHKRENPATGGRMTHHDQAVVVSGPCALRFSFVACCCFIIDRGICYGLPMLGHFVLLLLSSLIH